MVVRLERFELFGGQAKSVGVAFEQGGGEFGEAFCGEMTADAPAPEAGGAGERGLVETQAEHVVFERAGFAAERALMGVFGEFSEPSDSVFGDGDLGFGAAGLDDLVMAVLVDDVDGFALAFEKGRAFLRYFVGAHWADQTTVR